LHYSWRLFDKNKIKKQIEVNNIFIILIFHAVGWYIELKTPYEERYIAGSSTCSTKELSIHLTKILSAVKEGQQKYCKTVYLRSGINHMWILKNSKDLLDKLKSRSFSHVSSIKTLVERSRFVCGITRGVVIYA
jgi:hypothetical protein